MNLKDLFLYRNSSKLQHRMTHSIKAAVFTGGGIGVGAVIRSNTGKVLAAGVRRYTATWDA